MNDNKHATNFVKAGFGHLSLSQRKNDVTINAYGGPVRPAFV